MLQIGVNFWASSKEGFSAESEFTIPSIGFCIVTLVIRFLILSNIL